MGPRIFYKTDHSTSFTIHQWFVVSCSFSYFLLCGRMIATGSLAYGFLLWNLFLAFVPYAISCRLTVSGHATARKWKFVLLLFCWLLFIPNSFYILTDLFHLAQIKSAPAWFDLLLLLSFAWNGLLFGIASIRRIEFLVLSVFSRKTSFFIVFLVMWLNAFGIYIGRFLRYNSWDVVVQPFSLLADMFEMMLSPYRNKMEWAMILCYALFMSLLYVTIRTLSESFNQLNK